MALKFIESQNVEFKSNYCEANNALVEIEQVRGFLDAVKLKDDWVADMQEQQHIVTKLDKAQELVDLHRKRNVKMLEGHNAI